MLFLFEQVLALLEVCFFEESLSPAKEPQPASADFTATIATCGATFAADDSRFQTSEQFVFHRQEELKRPGITLASGATHQLTVDSGGAVHLGGNNVQST